LRIGEELDNEALADCSLLAADYQTGDDAVGRVAVIGPARMDYATAIPFLDCTAEQLGAVLTDEPSSPSPETV
jgi:heat-inducible transcriptional repressor